MERTTFLIIISCFISGCLGRKGFGPGEQEWGYEAVRPGAQMFWWLYYTTANVPSYYDKPLLIWLQGGPGASSTSYGNFEEIGPIDSSLKPRNYTWVKNYNVLFIDNPVGTGFSSVSSTEYLSVTNAQIAKDLVECMRGFLKKLPKFSNVPTYILTESYGGKMGAEFALVWDKAQKTGAIKSNLRGVGLGDAWISPVDSVMTWAPFLLSMGMIDKEEYKLIDKAATSTKQAVEQGSWSYATNLWANTENVILRATSNIDFYNILEKVSSIYTNRDGIPLDEDLYAIPNLHYLMNVQVLKALNLTTSHGYLSRAVFSKLRGDFMKPVTNIVEQLLNETSLKVFVYTGHLDLIVDTPGTLLWVERLKWTHAKNWQNSYRHTVLGTDGIIEGYVKSYSNFSVYWINRAGHMVPRDNPTAMAQLLKDLTK